MENQSRPLLLHTHPIKICMDDVFKPIPDVIFVLIMSFLRLRDIKHIASLENHIYHKTRKEFFLPQPTTMFAPSVWEHRIIKAQDVGTISYGMRAMRKLNMIGALKSAGDVCETIDSILVANFNAYLSIMGHNICGNGFRKLISRRGRYVSSNESSYLNNHYKSDWIPRFTDVVTNTDVAVVLMEGLDLIVLRIVDEILQQNFQDDGVWECLQEDVAQHFCDITMDSVLGPLLLHPHTATDRAHIRYMLESHENPTIRDQYAKCRRNTTTYRPGIDTSE